MQTSYDYRQAADKHFRAARDHITDAADPNREADVRAADRSDADLNIRLAHLALALAEANTRKNHQVQ